MIMALEASVSLVGMNDTNHGKRVGYLASQIGKAAGFSSKDCSFAYELGLLHDCGVSTQQMHSQLVNHFDWEESFVHCEIGYWLLKDFAPLSCYANPIRYHHTPFERSGNLGITPYDRSMANLIFLADRVDILASPHYKNDILLARKNIVDYIDRYAKEYFDPRLVLALHSLASSEALWLGLEDRHIVRYVWDMAEIDGCRPLSLDELKQLSLIFAYIVDQKSSFTAEHSIRVSDLSCYLAEVFGLSVEQCDKIQIAGLLHDIGKLHMPDSILEKPGPLNNMERSVMNQHSYETFQILSHIKGLGDIAKWAAYHHEGINGAGYPFHPLEKNLSIEARIIAVADIFQALVQDRPYRAGMKLEDIFPILLDMVAEGKLDPDIVRVATENRNICYRIAKGLEPKHNQQALNPLILEQQLPTPL